MEDSIFVDDRQTPLLNDFQGGDYELLQDDGDGSSSHFYDRRGVESSNWDWSTLPQQSQNNDESENDDGLRQSIRGMLPPIPSPPDGVHSAECVMNDIYYYYRVRGLWKYITNEIGHMVLLTWLILFCIFLGTCVNYAGIMQHRLVVNTVNGSSTVVPTTTDPSLWQYISFSSFGQMSWYFVMALVLYSIYAVWRVIKFARDLRRLVRVKKFYNESLQMTDFDLRTALWSDVQARLKTIPELGFATFRVGTSISRLRAAAQHPMTIAALVTKKENFFKKLVELGQFDFVFRWRSLEVMMLTRGLQWNIMYCIVNFFFDSEMQLRNTSGSASVSRLKKRIVVLTVLNVLLLPFLVVFVALYALFRYGEQFYKNPSTMGARQWSIPARWYFRDYNELPHVLEERLRVAAKHAKIYTRQFASSPLEGIARTCAFIVGSIVVWLLLITFLNERALLSLDLSPGKALLWWITVLSSIWVASRGVLQSQQVFYPQQALNVVYKLTRRLPQHFVDSPGSQTTLQQFKQLFPLQLSLLVLEFIGLLVTPYILMRRIYPHVDQLVQAVRDQVRYDDVLHHHFVSLDLEEGGGGAQGDLQESVTDYKESEVLRSASLIPYLQQLDYVED